jgi:orotidine-5'-phosphate decarboxylase
MNSDCGILVNSTRDIIYASDSSDFAGRAGQRAKEYQQKMRGLLGQFMPIA